MSDDPAALASTLRQHLQQAEPAFRVSNIRTQTELIYAQTIRERLLAMLAAFFAAPAKPASWSCWLRASIFLTTRT